MRVFFAHRLISFSAMGHFLLTKTTRNELHRKKIIAASTGVRLVTAGSYQDFQFHRQRSVRRLEVGNGYLGGMDVRPGTGMAVSHAVETWDCKCSCDIAKTEVI